MRSSLDQEPIENTVSDWKPAKRNMNHVRRTWTPQNIVESLIMNLNKSLGYNVFLMSGRFGIRYFYYLI